MLNSNTSITVGLLQQIDNNKLYNKSTNPREIEVMEFEHEASLAAGALENFLERLSVVTDEPRDALRHGQSVINKGGRSV